MNINYYNPYVRQELELYHHGVAGQKWGKRNGPPYPLAASAHSASEKKAGWRKSLDVGSKDYSKRNARLAKKYDNKAAKAQEKMLKAYDDSQKYGNTAKGKREWEKSKKYRSKYFDNEKMSKRFADAGSKKISRFTPEQKARAKKIAVTALKVAGAIAITALAIYGVKTLNTNSLKSLHKIFAEEGALAAARNERENHYIADYVGRTGYQRMLDMRDRHPHSRVAARAVQSAWNQHIKSVDKTLRIARRANRAGNKLSYYNNPSINPLKKLGSQVLNRPIY